MMFQVAQIDSVSDDDLRKAAIVFGSELKLKNFDYDKNWLEDLKERWTYRVMRAGKKAEETRTSLLWTGLKSSFLALDKDLFREWLKSKNGKVNGNSALILDNWPPHHAGVAKASLTNFRPTFLPPNTTNNWQPLDRGIITIFKDFYKEKYLKHMKDQEKTQGSSKCQLPLPALLTLPQAVECIKEAWNRVTNPCINYCWGLTTILNTTPPTRPPALKLGGTAEAEGAAR